MYFCGLKGMMPGILDMLEGVAKEKGLDWEDKLKEWKKAGQWHVEACATPRGAPIRTATFSPGHIRAPPVVCRRSTRGFRRLALARFVRARRAPAMREE